MRLFLLIISILAASGAGRSEAHCLGVNPLLEDEHSCETPIKEFGAQAVRVKQAAPDLLAAYSSHNVAHANRLAELQARKNKTDRELMKHGTATQIREAAQNDEIANLEARVAELENER